MNHNFDQILIAKERLAHEQLRDYFAGQALMSMLSSPDKIGEGTYQLAAELSYKFADAMMEARKK